MDYTDIRKLAIEFSGLSGMDDTYTFYYDETNNSRKFRITEKDFNSSKDEDFVIGGLVYEGENRQFSLDKLFQSFKLQSNVKEIKRQHIAPGKTFLECVKSPKLQLLLKWIIENEVYVHFMAMNNLYFGIVDIIDSLVDDTKFSMLPPDYINLMKNTLYKYINADIDYIHSVFLKYNYPNIQSDNVQPFCEDFIAWIENINVENEQEDFGLESVRQILKASRRKENLCFLSDNKDLILMDRYESLYVEPIYMFPHSQHIFDEEVEIVNKIKDIPICIDNQILCNYAFVKSKSSRWIQLSDVIIGLLGKMFLYANSKSNSEIINETMKLSDMQKENISLLKALIEKSEKRCLAFIHFTANFYEIEKVKLILSMK